MSRPTSTARFIKGVTLIEQLIALAVAIVLVGVAIPPLGRLWARERLIEAQTALVDSLRYAREEALRRGTSLIVCPTLDGQQCADTSRWDTGWITGYATRTGSGPHRLAGTPLRTHSQRPGLRITSTVGRPSVVFRNKGDASGTNIGLLICDPKQAQLALRVYVANSGRIRGESADAASQQACRDSL
ncbi:MAG TPA: GspH/FimT family pseudopilin [Dyella sp.]|uniref:GspH/FimT family pseudopilin n=1 Tax=Dyella sp. TaxID=1869338 RepID=UPI002F950A68